MKRLLLAVAFTQARGMKAAWPSTLTLCRRTLLCAPLDVRTEMRAGGGAMQGCPGVLSLLCPLATDLASADDLSVFSWSESQNLLPPELKWRWQVFPQEALGASSVLSSPGVCLQAGVGPPCQLLCPCLSAHVCSIRTFPGSVPACCCLLPFLPACSGFPAPPVGFAYAA